ncbi:Reticuline oxidase [Fusarium albosuccineum]|uniref:Reticuline oxidase n=1 Tax=Fusarium albosuccineum TaxID=1237068 RepID=A0A8H4P942_9HYPO|nr:Reticuline oxidase [Fusarium albosuccineum]
MAPTNRRPKANDAPSDDDVATEKAKREYKEFKSSWSLRNTVLNFIVPMASAFTLWINRPVGLTPPPKGLRSCLDSICDGTPDCVKYPGIGEDGEFFQWSKPFNMEHIIRPAAVVRPNDAKQVSAFVQCAAENYIRVQARSGGHSYANYGVGGYNGSLSIDLQKLRYVKLDEVSWHAAIGGGSLLGDIDALLDNKKGNRAFPHGVCPGVGIGGHATIGGLGPSSRMWGATLDHIVEVEVVTANGTIVRASETEHQDLFFAIRGAAAGFGIVTEFVMKTVQKPKTTIHFTHRTPYSNAKEIVRQFRAWQALVADPGLDRRIGTEFTLDPDGSKITATWFGTKDEFNQSGIAESLGLKLTPVESSWVNTMRWQIENERLILSDIPNQFFSRSLGFTAQDLLTENATEYLVDKISQNKDQSDYRWFCIFDATGGKVSDPATDSTAYAHRDKVMFYQSYVFNIWAPLGKGEQRLLNEIHDIILRDIPAGPRTTYPGYVDPLLEHPQQAYWGSNLPRLQQIKADWDAGDIFGNPQSVQPLK